MMVEVAVPIEFQGGVMAQLNRRGGIIVSTDANEGWCCISSEVPLNNMFGYSTELRSATQGRGEFTMEYCRYSPAKPDLQQELIQSFQGAREEDMKRKKKN